MKKIYSMMLVAAAAMAFVSCQKQENFAPEVSTEEVVLTFASEKPAFDDETKTEWTGETIQWSAGDKISVAYTVAGTWQNANGNASGNAKIYQSNPISEAASVANFSVPTSFTGGTEGTHVFYAVYPALGDNNFPSAPVANISISPNQNPKANSFDSSADVMVGVSGEYDVRPNTNETISLMWDRLVAHAVITLKNINGLTAEESLKYITLTAQADANLVGQQEVDLIEKTVVKDNEAANILKLSADKLSVADGTVTFWACVLPETITSLTVEVETDKATYTREITGISKEFKKNARNILAVNMEEAVRVENAVDNNVTDVLTRATTGVTGTSYSSWEGKTLTSGAVYAGQSAGGNESIQLRSSNSNSGVISTTSGGYAKKVVVTWNSNTASGRTLNIYGSNTAYTNPTELYNNDTRGTLLGTIVCGTSVELDVEGDYEYIGMRSASGAMYLEKIEITWAPAAPKENYLEVSTNAIEVEADATSASFAVYSDLEWTASSDNASVSTEGNTVKVSFVANEETEEKTYTVTVSASGVEPQIVTITQAAVEPETPVFASLAELIAAIEPTTTATKVTVTLTDEEITGIYTTGSGYRNGVFLQVGGKEIEIYCYNVPTEWEVGGTVSGTLTECDWKLYNTTWELCPADWSELTYKAPAGSEPETPGTGGGDVGGTSYSLLWSDTETTSGYTSSESSITASDGSVWAIKGYLRNSTNQFIQLGKGGANYITTPVASAPITKITVTCGSSYYLTVCTTDGTELMNKQPGGGSADYDNVVEFDLSSYSYTQVKIISRRSSGTSNAAVYIQSVVVE